MNGKTSPLSPPPIPESSAVLEFAASPSQGQQIWVWGYPLGTTIALEPSVAVGIVSATETAQGFIALDVSGAPGNSGGPVVNAEGRVIGIFVASWIAGGHGATGFKYAASSTAASTLLSSVKPNLAPAAPPQSSDATVRPGNGIGRLKLGMTAAQAQDTIGLPPTKRYPSGWSIWETRKLAIYFDNGKAFMIDTEDPAELTPEGVRIGSTDIDLVKAYGTPVCASVQTYRGKAYLGGTTTGSSCSSMARPATSSLSGSCLTARPPISVGNPPPRVGLSCAAPSARLRPCVSSQTLRPLPDAGS